MMEKNSIPAIQTPCLATLNAVEKTILSQVSEIEAWFRGQWALTPPPVTSSVDLRNAGFKLAPVDTNLFPAGFNNLNPAYLPLCIQAVQAYFLKYYPNCRRILLIPEQHTRNQYYFQSVRVLYDIFVKAGFHIRLGTFHHSEESMTVGDMTLTLYPVTRIDDRVHVGDFNPCLVILNNDMSAGVPSILQALRQPILPDLNMGWITRRKSDHFSCYNRVIADFCAVIPLDSWVLNPVFETVSEVDFLQQEGMDRLADATERLLRDIGRRYHERGITEKPFIVMKADNGTYGMSVMMIHDAHTIRTLNRKQRNKMSAIKGGARVTQVILQEGVYTFETTHEKSVAEPVVYMLGQYVVGGFYRVHTEKGVNDNLNAPGMHFEPLPFAHPCNMPCEEAKLETDNNRFYVYSVVARLAALAAARESVGMRGVE